MIRIFEDENPNISYLEFKKKISGSIMKSIDNQENDSSEN
jgi:hypothetical protein